MFYTEVIDKILLHQMFQGIPCAWSASLLIQEPLQRREKKNAYVKNSKKSQTKN